VDKAIDHHQISDLGLPSVQQIQVNRHWGIDGNDISDLTSAYWT
jgi:hypothetical protein